MKNETFRVFNCYRITFSLLQGVILTVLIFAFPNTIFAQKNSNQDKAASVLNLQLEIFLTVIDDVNIDVYIDGVLNATVGPTTNVCDPLRAYDWAVSTEGSPAGTECPGQVDTLNSNQLYELEFQVSEGGG